MCCAREATTAVDAATRALIVAANRLIPQRRWYLEFPEDWPIAVTLKRALAAPDGDEGAGGTAAFQGTTVLAAKADNTLANQSVRRLG